MSIHMSHGNPITLSGEKCLRLSPGDTHHGDAQPPQQLLCLADYQKPVETTKTQHPGAGDAFDTDQGMQKEAVKENLNPNLRWWELGLQQMGSL